MTASSRFGRLLQGKMAIHNIDRDTLAGRLGCSNTTVSTKLHSKKGADAWSVAELIILFRILNFSDAEILQTLRR